MVIQVSAAGTCSIHTGEAGPTSASDGAQTFAPAKPWRQSREQVSAWCRDVEGGRCLGLQNDVGGLWPVRLQTSRGLRARFVQAFASINFFHLLALPSLPHGSGLRGSWRGPRAHTARPAFILASRGTPSFGGPPCVGVVGCSMGTRQRVRKAAFGRCSGSSRIAQSSFLAPKTLPLLPSSSLMGL